MKKLLIGIAVQIGVLNMAFGQQINALELHEGSTKSVHALSHIDSIGHKTDSLTIYKGSQQETYSQNGIDSAKYVALASASLPCSFDGYTGQYGTMTDSRDGNEYKTVTIGNQTWMAENLRYDVPAVYTGGSVVDTINANNPCKAYGRLYDWNTMMNGDTSSSGNPLTAQGICPSGWHIPSNAEWTTLETSIGGNAVGTAMKSTSSWSSNGNGSNASGFSAFPAGTYDWGIFDYLGDDAYFWSSTERSASDASRLDLYTVSAALSGGGSSNKGDGYSCRCVEN